MHPENDPSAGLSSDGIASPAVEFHESGNTYRAQFDVHTRPASEAILTAVATATENELLELPPLYSSVDPDALDALFDPLPCGASERGPTVTFEYAGCRVSAKARGTVVVEPGRKDGRAE